MMVSSAGPEKLPLLTDAPIDEQAFDQLNFGVYAEVISASMRDTEGHLTISILGEWGSGKTSLMRLIKAKLDSDPDLICVWFDAWRYEQDANPVLPLIATIISSIQADRNRGANASAHRTRLKRRLVQALRAVAQGFSVKAKIAVPPVIEVEASLSGKEVLADLRGREATEALLETSIFHAAFEKFEKLNMYKEDRLRVAVFVDDLDRCMPHRAVQLLDSVKLVLAQPGFCFALGLSNTVLEDYLGHRFETEFGGERSRGRVYLDKITQTGFRIPPNRQERLEPYLRFLLDGRMDFHNDLVTVLAQVGRLLDGNPRGLKRLINSLIIDAAVYRRLEEASPQMSLFALTRCLQQHREPFFARAMRLDPALAAKVSEWEEGDVTSAIDNDHDDLRWIATQLQSDEILRDVVLSKAGRDWLRKAEARQQTWVFLKKQARLLDPSPDSESPLDVVLIVPNEHMEHAGILATELNGRGLSTYVQAMETVDDWIRQDPQVRAILAWWSALEAVRHQAAQAIKDIRKNYQDLDRLAPPARIVVSGPLAPAPADLAGIQPFRITTPPSVAALRSLCEELGLPY